jgi:hypothetical protein
MTNFGQLTGFLQSAAVRSFLVVMASAVVLSGCAANQQTANQQTATAISPQEEKDRSVCLQHAHRDSGLNEKAFTSCMTKKGYKKDKLNPSVTTADAGNPPLADAGSPPISNTLSDTWKKIVQAVSPDNAARQPDGENAGQGSSPTENTTQPPSPAVY